jgi:hypothetical protein
LIGAHPIGATGDSRTFQIEKQVCFGYVRIVWPRVNPSTVAYQGTLNTGIIIFKVIVPDSFCRIRRLAFRAEVLHPAIKGIASFMYFFSFLGADLYTPLPCRVMGSVQWRTIIISITPNSGRWTSKNLQNTAASVTLGIGKFLGTEIWTQLVEPESSSSPL